MKVLKHWPRLLREVAHVPSLVTSKVRQNGALSNLTWLEMSPCRGCGLDALKGPFQLKLFYHYMT